MSSDLLPISFHKILQSRSYTVIVLEAEEKKFTIYTEPHVGKDIQTYLTQEKKPRPSSHDLIQSIFTGFNIHPIQVVIQDVEDTVYFARLFLEMQSDGKKTILEIDARPSDCILLALLYNIPMYCRKAALEKAVAVQ